MRKINLLFSAAKHLVTSENRTQVMAVLKRLTRVACEYRQWQFAKALLLLNTFLNLLIRIEITIVRNLN